MTSKRELERRLDGLDNEQPTASGGPRLADAYPSAVVDAIHTLFRDLLRIKHRNADTIVNASEPEATEQYLALVRERYAIDADRDGVVRRMLEDFEAESWQHTPHDVFSDAPIAVAIKYDLETQAGETLTDLVQSGREDEMERFLVETTYDYFAARGSGRRAEVQM